MKKKFMILLVVALFISIVFSTGCKKGFDITGSWTLTDYFVILDLKVSSTITFTGDKDSGTFVEGTDNFSSNGTYTVSGDNVTWTYDGGSVYSGTRTDDNTMSGTSSGFFNTTWTAVR